MALAFAIVCGFIAVIDFFDLNHWLEGKLDRFREWLEAKRNNSRFFIGSWKALPYLFGIVLFIGLIQKFAISADNFHPVAAVLTVLIVLALFGSMILLTITNSLIDFLKLIDRPKKGTIGSISLMLAFVGIYLELK
jgi:hypothetical protein